MGTLRHHIALGLAGIVLVAGVITSAPLASADGGDMTAGSPQAAANRVTAGDKHSCVITSDAPTAGGVFCWGNNALGQLGLGDTSNRGDQPGEMGDALAALDLGAPATSISAGAAHTCAVLAGGSVKCWGYNSSGQLGVGDTNARGDQPGEMGAGLPAVSLGTGRTAVAVTSGGEFSCALLDNGSGKGWGDNNAGQLGVGDTADRGDQAGEMGDALPAVDLGTARTAISITAGGAFACAVLDTHAVKCWGNNDNGQ